MNKLCILASFLVCLASYAADVTWTGTTNTNWMTGTNWSNGTGPIQADAAIINSGTPVFSSGVTPGYNAIRQYGGTVTFSGGTFNATNNTSWESQINGTLLHTGTNASINSLEIGRSTGATGNYNLSGGILKVSRSHSGNSLFIGANKSATASGTGTLQISGGTFTTRAGVKLGDATVAGTGNFTVLGSVIEQIGVGAANTDTDGTWVQNAGSTLKVGVDSAGLRKIVIKDSSTATTTATSATFAAGSKLDVGYYDSGWGIGSGGGSWTVMEVENGPINASGLDFAPGVNTSIWSKTVDNSGANGKLIITATGAIPANSVFWTGATDSNWGTATNWSTGVAPSSADIAYVTYGTPTWTTGTNVNFNRLRLWGGKLTVSGGTFTATSTNTDSHVDSVLEQTAGSLGFNELEVGRTVGKTGSVVVSGGSFNVARSMTSNSLAISLFLGANRTAAAGTGSFEISGGSMTTRAGVKLGAAGFAGTGKFTVLGSTATQVGIAAGNTDSDGIWLQNTGSTLKVGIDFGGVTPIVIKDGTATTGTSATFAAGSLLDVGYYNGGYGGGTWTVMEVENGTINDQGLQFAPGVDPLIWSKNITTYTTSSGINTILTVTAVGEPAGFVLTVGSTKKQKMRYGMDYERLWYWTNSTSAANKAKVAQWSTVDCDIDYVRVAMNSEYELTEGTYDLTAYTDKIIPMMQAMKAANPNIKFFASPRPLNEAAGYSSAAWQPYPLWITGSSSMTSTTFNFQWLKCAQYLVRYVNLMKSYGFKISFMDLTNEWNYVTATHIRDIKAYMLANLAAEDMPLMVAPSAWNYTQGSSWLNGATSTAMKAALDILSCHNTDKTGLAQDFANKVESVWPGQGKEVWNTELHGWKSTSGADEALSSAYFFECIRAGFSGMSGWLAIGTTNQGHCYILNPSGTPTRNVKYFIFKKLTTTSNYGNALDINQPAEFAAAVGSDEEDAGTSTSALIRGNLMTVWVMNHAASAKPIIITPTGRTISGNTVQRTVWNTSLAVEGVSSQISVTNSANVWSSVPARSVVCYELLLNPIGPQFAKIEAESYNAMNGITTETTTDVGGGQNVTNISNGDWCRYDNLAPGTGATLRLRVARAAGSPGGRIDIRLDSPTGTLIGTANVYETGGLQTWETIDAALDPVVGTRSIFLNFIERAATPIGTAMFNLNWLAITLPVSPAGLSGAAASATQVALSWTAVPGAASYTIKRSTTSGGPYTTIATGVSGTSYTDSGRTAGVVYYYVVSTVYVTGESGDSPQVQAVPSAPIDLKDVVISSLVSQSNGSGGENMVFSIIKSGLGHAYQVETNPALTGTWQNVGGVVAGNGGLLQLSVPKPPGEPRRFYRVKVWRQ